MNFLIDNWFMFFAGVAAILSLAFYVFLFFKKPTASQIKAVKEWLLYAVIEAERQLGSGTGDLKLRYVYDMFVGKFPFVAKLISFETFSMFVDNALVKMEEMIENSEALFKYIHSNK